MEHDEPQQQMDGASLATRYHLGVPLKRHTHLLDRIVSIGCSVIFMAFLLLILLTIIQLLLQQQSLIFWFGLVFAILATLRMAFFFISSIKMIDHSWAYECSEGFVVVSDRRQGRKEAPYVLLALRWDKITQVWKDKPLGRRNAALETRYYIRDQQGRQHRIKHPGIWKRCRKELARRDIAESEA